MNDWQVQEMWEADAAAEWERLNAPDPNEKELIEAGDNISRAICYLDDGADFLAEAVGNLEETPMADKIQSFLNDLEEMANELEKIAEHYQRGERE
jgi:hypothetical protein